MLTIKIKNFNILCKNYIYKDIKKKISNKYNYINTKFAPEPNGFIHLGNLKSFYINLVVSKIYNGLSLIKLDDTNPSKEKIIYKNNIIKTLKYYLKNCKNNFIKKLNYSSFFFFKIVQLSKLLLKKKIVNNYSINFLLKGFSKERKECLEVLIVRRVYKILRIKYLNHYKIKYNFYLYSMYNYINIISDKFLNIKYSLCSIEFEKYKLIFKWFNSKIFIKIKIYQKEFDRINFLNNLTKKKKIFFLKKEKKIKNYKDLRLINFETIKAFYKNANNLFNLFEKLNLNKNIRVLKLNLIKKNYYFLALFSLLKIILIKNKFKIYIYNCCKNSETNFKIKKFLITTNFVLKLSLIKKYKDMITINYKLIKILTRKVNNIKKYNKTSLKLIKYYNIIKNLDYNIKSKKLYKSCENFFRLKWNSLNKINKNVYIKISALHDLNV